MTQPTSKRLITESVFVPSQSVQDARLSQLEAAAGFPNPPLAVEDATVAAVVNSPESETREALDTYYSPLVAGRISVKTQPGDATAELQRILDDLAENGGGTLEIPDTGSEHAISSTLFHGPNTRIVGQGKGTTLGGVGNFTLLASKDPLARSDNNELSNLTVNRYGSGSTADKPIIDWTGVAHSKMQGVAIRQGTARAGSVGVLLGLNSYYNEFNGVQARELNTCFKLQDAANGNRFNGGTVALFSDNGWVVDNSNSNAFLGASVEQLSGVGFDFVNGSKMNQVMGCRLEVMAIGIRAKWSATNPAFSNFFIGNAFYLGADQVDYDLQADNVVIDKRLGYVLKNLYAADQRTFVSAYKNTAQGSFPIATWTKILFQNEDSDQLSEFSGSTFTAKVSGIYDISAQITATSPTDSDVQLGIYKNGDLFSMAGRGTMTSTPKTLGGTRTLSLSAGDTIEIWASSGASGLSLLSGRTSSGLQILRRG